MVNIVDKPWRILEGGGGKTDPPTTPKCERLGCKVTTLVRLLAVNPHTGLVMKVCRPCYFARNCWDELNRAGESKSMQIDLRRMKFAYHEE